MNEKNISKLSEIFETTNYLCEKISENSIFTNVAIKEIQEKLKIYQDGLVKIYGSIEQLDYDNYLISNINKIIRIINELGVEKAIDSGLKQDIENIMLGYLCVLIKDVVETSKEHDKFLNSKTETVGKGTSVVHIYNP